ncbi:phosphatidate cytidylyltransferase [Helicostylum pulchrum]|nr:phosphatidate cytidylyltransferase [Helicostylum pulchrum]
MRFFPHVSIMVLFLTYSGFMLWVCLILDNNVKTDLADCLLHTFYVHVVTIYTTVQPTVIHFNICNGGIFWFLFPCSLVVCNDTAAFICGRLFGKHKLLNVSPSKTVEGFIGAGVITVLFAYKFSSWLSQFDKLTSNHDIYDDIQWHGVILALFASIYAPFGGFFTSSIKRAAKIKDFGQLIPGHGGLTDRVDCQLFVSVFTFVYFKYIT